jgi:hypothetical protein
LNGFIPLGVTFHDRRGVTKPDRSPTFVPNEASVLRLVSAVLIEIDED